MTYKQWIRKNKLKDHDFDEGVYNRLDYFLEWCEWINMVMSNTENKYSVSARLIKKELNYELESNHNRRFYFLPLFTHDK